MLSAEHPGGGGPTGAESCTGPAGSCTPRPAGNLPGPSLREPLAEWVLLSWGERETPADFRCQRPGSAPGWCWRAHTGSADEKRHRMSPGGSSACSARGARAVPSRRTPRSFFCRGNGAKITVKATASALREALWREPSRGKSANHFSLPNVAG